MHEMRGDKHRLIFAQFHFVELTAGSNVLLSVRDIPPYAVAPDKPQTSFTKKSSNHDLKII